MATIIPPPQPPQPQPPQPQPQPQQPKPAEGKPQPNISPNEAVSVVVSEMQRGSLSQATYKYLNCVDNCYKSYGEGKNENQPKFRKRLKGEKMSISYSAKQRRFAKWKKKNKLLNRCLQRCKNQWNRAVINLIGEANFKLNEDILNHILSMLIVDLRLKKKKRKKNKTSKAIMNAGSKTRRKKGTKRKRKKSRRRRKSKRRN